MKTSIPLTAGAALAAIALAPLEGHARNFDSPAARTTLVKFRNLQNGRSAPKRVRVLASRMTRYRPQEGKRWMKLAMLKLQQTYVERKGDRISGILQRLVRRSSLSPRKKVRIQRQIRLIQRRTIQFNEPGSMPG